MEIKNNNDIGVFFESYAESFDSVCGHRNKSSAIK